MIKKSVLLGGIALTAFVGISASAFAEPVELEVSSWKGGGSELAGFPDSLQNSRRKILILRSN